MLTGAVADLEPLSLKRHVCLGLAITNGALRAAHRLLPALRGPTYPQYLAMLTSRDNARASAEPLSGMAIARLWPTSATLSPLPQLQSHGLVTRSGHTQHEPAREVPTATSVSVLAAGVLDSELDR